MSGPAGAVHRISSWQTDVMGLPEGFRDLLPSLCDAAAESFVVGNHAVAFYGRARATKDLDVLVRADEENATRVYRALAKFDAPIDAFDVRVEDFATYVGVLQIGVPPFRVDVPREVPPGRCTVCHRPRRLRP